ncbi:sensor domain-containing diguanylate cyclase [Bowmanella denitrificans]|uniref:sensor domain-containing diguanylate cyclase n=1 Tax=Bowmanella denitrificans TaxID=366582 RepID=UPI0011AF6522|nr:sensor domain-containing diguanylate cyclase [Bowmanella denitrificans]
MDEAKARHLRPTSSLVRRLTQLNLAVMAGCMLLAFTLITLLLWLTARERQAEAAEISIAQLAHNVLPMVIFGDSTAAKHELSLVGQQQQLLYVAVRDREAKLFAELTKPDFSPPKLDNQPLHSTPYIAFSGLQLMLHYPMWMQEQLEGDVLMVMDITGLLYWFLRVVVMLAFLLALLFAGSAMLLARVQRQALAPLLSLTALAQQVGQEHNFTLRASVVREDEIGILTLRFNDLLKRLEKWQKELNQQLQQEQLQGQQLKQLAYRDALTNLPNRLALNTRLKQLTSDTTQHHTLSCLMFIDLDNFKYVNDHFGHDAGDETLVTVARRIQKMVRDTDLLCRLGGDEFALLLTRVSQPEAAEKLAERIVKKINEPIVVKEKVMPIGISIGLAYYPTDATSSIDLLNCADEAMYCAKRAGKNDFRVYSRGAT